jgi:small subunit ribosomal protein S18
LGAGSSQIKFPDTPEGLTGNEESEEETSCLKKTLEERLSSAHRHHRNRNPDLVPDPAPAAGPLARLAAASGAPGGRPSGGPGGRGKFFRRKKVCKFCTEKIDAIPYRDVRLLQGFVAERGKIVPRRLTGVCTTHQRRLTRAIKQARNIALLPFATRH